MISNITLFSAFNGTNNTEKSGNRKIQPMVEIQEVPVHKKSCIETYVLTNVSNWQLDNSEDEDSEYFHTAISPILKFVQIFGIFPVNGIRGRDPGMMTFRIKSLRAFYAFIILFLIFIHASFSSFYMIDQLAFIGHGVPEIFLSAVHSWASFAKFAILFWLCPKWIELQRQWRLMERKLNCFTRDQPKLRFKFYTISLVMLFIVIVEHTLWIFNTKSQDEPHKLGSIVEEYADMKHLEFDVRTGIVSIELIFGFVLMIIDKFTAVTMNFADLLIILVSIGLADRYKYLNRMVMSSISQDRPRIDWLQFRENYTILSSLVKLTDNCISPLILLSFAGNLFYICFRLFNGLAPLGNGVVGKVFFLVTFTFCVGRTFVLTLIVAQIHDESKKALSSIYSCPGSCFTIETDRLQNQIVSENVALTGMRFFTITRNFMLGVAGCIVTYEIVLLQVSTRVKP